MLMPVMTMFLGGAVFCDVQRHRLPNLYLLGGLLLALLLQGWQGGVDAVLTALLGTLVGLLLFIPMYALGGMAAGDVKLMAVTGAFTGYPAVIWAAALSVMCGGILAMAYLACKGSLGRFLMRYWVIVNLRSHVPASADDPARHRFPYALAIALGTLISLYWQPF